VTESGDLGMAGKKKNWMERNGRYYARVAIPLRLREFMEKKSQLTEPLGPDLRVANSRHAAAVARIRAKIDAARQKAQLTTRAEARLTMRALSHDEIAQLHYIRRVTSDDEARKSTSQWAAVSVDDLLAAQLRDGMAGKLDDSALLEEVGHLINHFRRSGSTAVKFGTPEWRELAMALCASEYEALSRVAERDEGIFSGSPAHPLFESMNVDQLVNDPVSISGLFQKYLNELKSNNRGAEVERRWTAVIDDFISFAKTDDARRITRKNVIEWKDAKLSCLAPKTVKDVYLTALKATFNWAVSNDLLETNPAEKVKIRVSEKVLNRPKGFTIAEATRILKATNSYVAPIHKTKTREAPQTSAAKKWAPLLCAFTGSRITEITQLRKSDIRMENEMAVIRISPDAGSVKNNKFRDVPLHQQILDLGFMDFVEQSADGPLFYPNTLRKTGGHPARIVSGRVSQWLQSQNLVPDEVRPNHGWRHAFKTLCREAGIDGGTIDAICGHSPRTIGEKYGNVTLVTMKNAIDKLCHYNITDV
jgi:integrase